MVTGTDISNKLDILQEQLVHLFTTDKKEPRIIRNIIIEAEEISFEDNAQSQYLLGEAYFLAGRFSAATTTLEKAVMLSPLNADYVGAFALAQWELGNPNRAEEYLKICRILDPLNGQYDFYLGALEETKHNSISALRLYRSARSKLRDTYFPERQRTKQSTGEAIARLTQPPKFTFGKGSIVF